MRKASLRNEIGIEVYIDNNKEIYDLFYANKELIEEKTGLKFKWQRSENKKASRIKAIKKCDVTNQEEWEECFKWFCNYILVIKRNLMKFVINKYFYKRQDKRIILSFTMEEKMKERINFLKIFKVREIIETILLFIIAFLLIDMFNIPTFLLENFDIHCIIALIVVITFFIIDKKFFNLINVNVFNYFDLILFAGFISTTIYILYSKYISYSSFKLIICKLLENMLMGFIILRLIIFYILDKKVNDKKEFNVYDIKKLYKNEIDNSNHDLIFLEEKDVDYDLLNRNKIIEDLFNSINYCKNKERFIISLTGKWGSGKTTILNIVKKQLNSERFIIIDNFETWKYNNEKSLLYGMFDEIIEKIGINFSTLEVKKFVNSCIAIVSAKTDINIGYFSFDYKIIDKIKLMICEYLEKNNKRVVFIIDNLERTNENNILVILKTISTILNIDRFIYVLSYDENEMQDIFNNKLHINYDYMDKVVQLPLSVPDINQEDIKNVCTTCLENLLVHYGINKKDIRKYASAINLFSKNIKDLRSFKRKINSICNCCFFGNNHLNKADYFLLELIRQENIELYKSIRKNYEYYVSEDQVVVYGYLKYDAKEFNERATKYFDQLFENVKNKEYKDILCLLFPNVEKYNNERRDNSSNVRFLNESIYQIPRDKESYRKSIIERRIYNAKFFDLYFIKQENNFTNIDSKIKEFIEWNNKIKIDLENTGEIKTLQKKLSKILYMYKGIEQKFIIETMEMYCSNLEKNKVAILMYLIKSQEHMDNTSIFLGLNAKERLAIVCAEIIKYLSEEELEQIKSIVEIDYKNMYFIREIIYWLKKENNSFSQDYNEKIYIKLDESYKKLIANVTTNNINIYSNKNYSRYNIYCLIDSEEGINQMKNINEKTYLHFYQI